MPRMSAAMGNTVMTFLFPLASLLASAHRCGQEPPGLLLGRKLRVLMPETANLASDGRHRS